MLSLYVLFLQREQRERRRIELLKPRSYTYATPAEAMGTRSFASHASADDKDPAVKQSKPTPPSKAVTRSPKLHSHLPRQQRMSQQIQQGHVPIQIQPQYERPREERQDVVEMEALSRQTTQFSRSSTLVAEADSTPSTPLTPQRRPVRPSSSLSLLLIKDAIQTRKKPRHNSAPVPPVPQIPLPVLDMPRLEEPFTLEFLEYAPSNRRSLVSSRRKSGVDQGHIRALFGVS